MKTLIFSIIFLAQFNSASLNAQGTRIKNTGQFITYILAVKNVREYVVIKDSVQEFARKIQASSSLTTEQKEELKSYYDAVQSNSEKLYSKLREDLLNKETRKQMLRDANGYVQNINSLFVSIKGSSDAFYKHYTEMTGVSKSFIGILSILLNQFLLPLVQAFINEQITDAVRKLADENLKPQIVITPWTSLKTSSATP